jgi:hypothetical protein
MLFQRTHYGYPPVFNITAPSVKTSFVAVISGFGLFAVIAPLPFLIWATCKLAFV